MAILPSSVASEINCLLCVRAFLAELSARVCLLPGIIKYSDECKLTYQTMQKSIQGQHSRMRHFTSSIKCIPTAWESVMRDILQPSGAVCALLFLIPQDPSLPPLLLSDLNLYKTRHSVYGQTLTFTVLLPPLDNFTANLLLLSDRQNCTECQPLSLARAQPHT